MTQPLVVTISHELGRAAAKRRIADGIASIRSQLAIFAAGIEEHWTGDRLDMRCVALGQGVSATIEVFDQFVRIEVTLSGVLSWFGGPVAGRIREHGQRMLEKK